MNKIISTLIFLITFPLISNGGEIAEKQNMLPVSVLLDPTSPDYGKVLTVFGYFKMSGSEGGMLFGRLCADRESAEKNYRPYCLTVTTTSDFARFLKGADEKFSLVKGEVEVEDALTSYPGKIVNVTRIERYDSR